MADRPPLATLGQLGKKIGYTPTGGEADRAEGLLAEASELIRDVAGRTWLNDAGDAVVDVPHRVQNICVAAAFRAFTNPEALNQRTLGDSAKSYDRTGREGGEDVYLTTSEERSVRKAAAGSSFVSVTLVSPYGGADVEGVPGW
ncbi:hypothetical protein [Micromonospora sp. NPDC049891]|uniref:hypothetical protein n=1 Tax=Micromonospora sp. NPDC049891 TaxID=3155655 RepID=UPI0033E9ED8D